MTWPTEKQNVAQLSGLKGAVVSKPKVVLGGTERAAYCARSIDSKNRNALSTDSVTHFGINNTYYLKSGMDRCNK